MGLRSSLEKLDMILWENERVKIMPIKTEAEMIYANYECKLLDEQTDMVSPAWFSIGRAYLSPENNYPCLIYNESDEPIGFINLYKWIGKDDSYSWSFFIDFNHQNKGYGRNAAKLAIKILKTAMPNCKIRLATETDNLKAQKLYYSLGFYKLEEMDGDDFVFELINDFNEINLQLTDSEWAFDYTNHDRQIVRAIVVDEEDFFYFVRADRDDDFGKAVIIETAGGGVEDGEDLDDAIKRELAEELGAKVEVICKIGTVSDYYNLIHRHNINNYYLCRATEFGEKKMTEDEISKFHLSTLRIRYEEAVAEYEKNKKYKLGRLIAQREMPILVRAKEILDRRRDMK